MNRPPVQIEYTPLFVRFLKHLNRKYRSVQNDLQPLFAELSQGQAPGTQIQRTRYTVYKVRVKNSNVRKGKSGGYRVIYYIRSASKIILLAIYSKTEQIDIPAQEIERMIDDYEHRN